MQCRQLADIALNAPAIKRGFLLPKLGFPRAHARTGQKTRINLQDLGILNFRLPRFFGSVCFWGNFDFLMATK